MSRFSKTLSVLVVVAATAGLVAPAAAFDRYQGIGRAATPAELKAWDIDVRPDFTGLPKGKGTVDQGIEVWEAHCASCHGASRTRCSRRLWAEQHAMTSRRVT